MIYGLLNNKFNALSDCIQSVARLSPDIVMFKKSGNDSQISRTMIVVSFVKGELTGISFDLE
jgi:hypothetical protein